MERQNFDNSANNEKPPVFGSWRRIYLTVIVNLAVLIILFYFFSKAFK